MVEKSRTLKFRKKGGKRNNKSKKYRQSGGAARITNVHLGCMDWGGPESRFGVEFVLELRAPPPAEIFKKSTNPAASWNSGRYPAAAGGTDIYLYKNENGNNQSLGHYQNFFYKLFDTVYKW